MMSPTPIPNFHGPQDPSPPFSGGPNTPIPLYPTGAAAIIPAPPHYEVIPNRIFVGGFPSSTTETELREHFEKFFPVKDVKMVKTLEGVSKGYGFVTFESEDQAEEVRQLTPKQLEFRNRKLNLGPAIRKMNSSPYTTGYAITTPSQLVSASPSPFGYAISGPQMFVYPPTAMAPQSSPPGNSPTSTQKFFVNSENTPTRTYASAVAGNDSGSAPAVNENNSTAKNDKNGVLKAENGAVTQPQPLGSINPFNQPPQPLSHYQASPFYYPVPPQNTQLYDGGYQENMYAPHAYPYQAQNQDSGDNKGMGSQPNGHTGQNYYPNQGSVYSPPGYYMPPYQYVNMPPGPYHQPGYDYSRMNGGGGYNHGNYSENQPIPPLYPHYGGGYNYGGYDYNQNDNGYPRNNYHKKSKNQRHSESQDSHKGGKSPTKNQRDKRPWNGASNQEGSSQQQESQKVKSQTGQQQQQQKGRASPSLSSKMQSLAVSSPSK